MLRITQIKVSLDKLPDLSYEEQKKAILDEILRQYHIKPSAIGSINIVKRSLDARKKENIQYIYTVDLSVENEKKMKLRKNMSHLKKSFPYRQILGEKPLHLRPVVAGMGPAGLFCGLELARAGFSPLILERGQEVDQRIKAVENFWRTGELLKNSNVQFGEGGAGTFSDGKLNTMVKDSFGRQKKIFDTLVSHGAPSEIAYVNKPHIGTDRLREVVKNIRAEILRLGGEIRFSSRISDLIIEDQRLTAVLLNEKETIPCSCLVLAIGHSARDTFSMLLSHSFSMQPKAFAIGVRMEHDQRVIGFSQYGKAYKRLPAADYKVTHTCSNGRGVYSFCMCPGGFVVNSSSEQGYLTVNGMSNYARDEKNANSAIIVSVTPQDFEDAGPLAGIEFQRKWEALAFQQGNGSIPVQLYRDFKENKRSLELGEILPNSKGSTALSNLRECLPSYVCDSIIEGVECFDTKIKGFANPDAVLSGVETRTSSPVRILRDDNLEAVIKGVYPCGEGAGYAGGITSAAMDGLKVAEQIIRAFRPAY